MPFSLSLSSCSFSPPVSTLFSYSDKLRLSLFFTSSLFSLWVEMFFRCFCQVRFLSRLLSSNDIFSLLIFSVVLYINYHVCVVFHINVSFSLICRSHSCWSYSCCRFNLSLYLIYSAYNFWYSFFIPLLFLHIHWWSCLFFLFCFSFLW